MATLLIVDDEPLVLAYVGKIAEALSYRILKADNGPRAISMSSRYGGVDALITDVRMPGMSGFELGRHLRTGNPRLPVLFISGFFEELEKPADFLDVPDVHFLDKPFSPSQLGSALLLLFASAEC